MDGTYTYPMTSIKVTGLRKTLKAMEAMGAETKEMRELMHRIGTAVVGPARGRVPSRTGYLAGTIRAGRGWTKAVVRAGFKVKPYAPIINYGWPSRGQPGRHYLDLAIQDAEPRILEIFADGMQEIVDRH